jgi:hypothetical protein
LAQLLALKSFRFDRPLRELGGLSIRGDKMNEVKSAAGAPFPFYIATLAALPVLQFAAGNTGRIAPLEALGILLTIVVPCLILVFALRVVFRKPQVTDLLVGLLFGMIFLPVTFLTPSSPKFIWMLPWIGLMALVVLWRESRRFLPVVLAGGTGILCMLFLYTTLANGIWFKRNALLSLADTAFEEVPQPAKAPAEKPDIYYFIFDRYQRADYLKKIYGFDNEPFLAELRKRGFYVANQSYSNYQRTAHSVVSSLNFDYLGKLETETSNASSDWYLIYSMFQDFRIGRFLKAQGYEIHFAGTWWEPTRRIGIADVTHNHYEARELLWVIYESSLLTDMSRWIGFRSGDPMYWQCQRSRLMFEDIREPAQSQQPRFYFAHFLIPHPPFVSHETGRCMKIDEVASRSRVQNYAGQITYANAEILKTIDALLAKPGPKPIIILQADEGPWPEQFAGDEVKAVSRNVSKVDWLTLTPELLREKMAILNAIYAPGFPASELRPDMTPVNTFRKVLRNYFNVPIELLPDRLKIYIDNNHLYNFKDVTDEVHKG